MHMLKLNVPVCGLTLNNDILRLKYIMISFYFVHLDMSSTIFENCLNSKFNSSNCDKVGEISPGNKLGLLFRMKHLIT